METYRRTAQILVKLAIASPLLALSFLWAPPASAQMTFDGSLESLGGAAPGPVPGAPNYFVNVGDGFRPPNNQSLLLHSFSQFNLGFGESVFFESGGISNIVSRVTGGDVSSIAGTISTGTTPGISFYLINPAGIIFGNGASVDISGAFLASTSDGISFNDETILFDTSNSGVSNNALLSISTDPGNFSDLGDSSGDISMSQADFTIPNGFLGFNARNITISNSQLNAATAGSNSAGGIAMTASSQVAISNSQLFANVLSGATGNGGLILVGAESIQISDGTQFQAQTDSGTSAGIINLRAGQEGTVVVDNSDFFVNSVNGSDGDAGLILIEGNTLVFDNRTQLQAQTTGIGQAGIIALRTDAQGSITFDNKSDAFSSIEENGSSFEIGVPTIFDSNLSGFFINSQLLEDLTQNFNAFNIVVETGTFNLNNSSTLQTVVRGTDLSEASSGVAGWIGISANEVSITNGTLQEFSGIFSSVGAGAPENSRAGAIVLDVGNLTLENLGAISTSIASDGTPGLIAIVAKGNVILRNNSLVASATVETANASMTPGIMAFPGAVVIAANGLGISGDSDVTVTNFGSGVAGDISISANVIAVEGGSGISAETFVSGDGGNIEFSGNFLVAANSSEITTNSGGNGGNITLGIQGAVYGAPSSDNDIQAAGAGNGGRIEFFDSPFLRNIAQRNDSANSNDITATGGISEGSVDFRSGTQDINPVQEQVTLPTDLIDASRLIAQGCAAGNLTAAQEIGELVVTGRGGLPPSPGEQLSGASMVPDLADVPDATTVVPPDGTTAVAPAEIEGQADDADGDVVSYAEAQGWMYGAGGEIVLTAAANVAEPRQVGWIIPVCGHGF